MDTNKDDSDIDNSKDHNEFIIYDEILQNAFANYPDKACLATKYDNVYKWKTFKEVENEIMKISNFFLKMLRLETEKDKCNFYTEYVHKEHKHNLIGIFSKPCEESFMSMISLHRIKSNITVLPIFDNIKTSDLTNILKETGLKTLILDVNCFKQFKAIHSATMVENLILIKGGDQEIREIMSLNIKVTNFSDISKYEANEMKNVNTHNEELSHQDYYDLNSRTSSRIILLNYTSKSYKGILISEKLLIRTFNSLARSKYLPFDFEDVYYSVNSYGDIPEYLLSLLIFSKGGVIGFCSPDICNLFDDIQILKPTVIYSFPKILFKIYEALQTIIKKLDESKKNVLETAIRAKIEHYQQEGSLNHHIWDKLLFNKMKNSMGGKIKLMLVGGGYLASHIVEFLKICISTDITQIYGVTETCGFISFSNDKLLESKFIGDVINNLEVKIKKNEQVGYFTPHINYMDAVPTYYGEICIKGTIVYSGTIKKYDNEIIDEEGWFHTGDYAVSIESIKEKSTNTKFIDRIENFLISEKGDLISPALLEDNYIECDLISHITVLQDEQYNLVGVVLLNKNKNFEVDLNKNGNKFKLRKGSYNINSGIRKNSINSLGNNNTNSQVNYRNDKRKQFKKSYSINEKDDDSSLSFKSNFYKINSGSGNSSGSGSSNSLSNMSNEDHSIPTPTVCDSFIENQITFESLMIKPNENEILKKHILDSLKLIWATRKLKNYEMINKIFILEKSVLPSIENGMMTSKLKLNRNILKKFYLEYLKQN